nr:hypothetical protein [Tanacetum cinerariifolium]
ENKSKVRNSRSKPVVSQVKACDVNSNSEIDKLTHAVNQQTSAVTTAITAMLKQFQATPPPALVKVVEENCVTCGGAHPYYQCLAVGGNTFPELRDNIQGYISAAAVNYNQGAARRWLKKEPPRSITTWEDLVSKFINEFFPPSRTTNLNPADQDYLNAAAGENLLERSTQDVLTIIEKKSKVRNSRSKPVVSQVKACDVNSNSEIDKLTHAVNQQTSALTTAITAMLKQFQATPPPALVKAVEENCVTCGVLS